MIINNLKNNLEKTLKLAEEQLIHHNNKNYDKEFITFPYLNMTIKVNMKTGKIQCLEKQLNLQEQILIVHYLNNYLINDESIDDDDTLISFKELSGGEMYLTPFTNRVIKPLINKFSNNLDEFQLAGEKLGGQLVSYGDKSIQLQVFPKVKLIYVLWEGDEEFSANGTVLFNHSIIKYLSTEDIAVLASQIVYQMHT